MISVKMNKRQKKVLWIVLAIVVGAFILANVDFNLKGFAVVTPSQEYSSPYPCPSGDNIKCNVKGVMQCQNQLGGRDIVSFRGTSDYLTLGSSIAFAIPGSSIMSSFIRGDQLSNANCGVSKSSFLYSVTNPFGEVHWTGSRLFICTNTATRGLAARYYDVGGSADISSSLKSGEICNQGKIRCSESSGGYSCSGEFRVEKSNMDKTVLFKEPLTYSSSSLAGFDISNQFNINSGNVVYVTGTGSDHKVISEVVDVTQQCTNDRCTDDKSGVIQCINGKEQTPNYCGSNNQCISDSQGVRCDSPIKIVSGQFIDSSNNMVTGYKADEQIKFRLSLSTQSSSASSLIIKAKLEDSQGILVQEITRTSNLIVGSSKIEEFLFNGISSTGAYSVVFDISYSSTGKVIPEPRYEFKISNPINLAVFAYSANAGTTVIYSNEPAVVELRVSQNNAPVTANINLIVKQAGTLLQNPIPEIKENKLDGFTSYTYKYNLNQLKQEVETLSITASAEREGYTTPQQVISPTIKKATVQIKYTNIDKFVDIKNGVYAITFETRTPQGTLVDSKNTIKVIVSGKIEDITSLLTGSDGIYSFDYNFEIPNQGYFFDITSSADELGSQTLRSAAINVIPDGGGLLQCVEHKDCTYPNICKDNQCVPPSGGFNYGLILIIGIGILLIIVVIKLIRRKKSQVSSSLTGY